MRQITSLASFFHEIANQRESIPEDKKDLIEKIKRSFRFATPPPIPEDRRDEPALSPSIESVPLPVAKSHRCQKCGCVFSLAKTLTMHSRVC